MARKKPTMKMRGDRLRTMRERAGMSQDDLGQAGGVSLRQIGRYETGEAEPTAHVLAQMAKALNCSADYLLGLVDDPTAIMPDMDAEMRSMVERFRQLPEDLRNIILALVFRK